MVLPGAVLFPGAMLPLYIFEPRYRLMLARALEGDRIFAVGMPAGEDGGSGVFPVGGAGIVRACVANVNGTSNLVLQGFARVRFLDWSDTEPHPSATVEELSSVPGSASASTALRKEILTMLRKLAAKGGNFPEHFVSILEQPCPPGEFADTASACLVADPAVRQRLLEELDVARRLEIVAAYLTHLLAPLG